MRSPIGNYRYTEKGEREWDLGGGGREEGELAGGRRDAVYGSGCLTDS